jgi:bacterioferritin-associated ferredoxin
MYVCICNAITEEEIQKHLPYGVPYAMLKTSAGTCCGLCIEYIERMEKELDAPVAQLE